MIHVSLHAIHRYQERVARVSEDEARAALKSPAIQIAARFGAPYVKLASGQRVVIEHGNVVTVLPVCGVKQLARGYDGTVME